MDAYGNPLGASLPSAINYKSQESDAETGMYYLRARYYDPTTGGFIGRDPVEGILTNPQTQNSYAYSLNNPINYSDPSGEWAWLLQNMPTFTRWGQNVAQACQKFFSSPTKLDLTEHAMEAMTKRGVSADQVQGVIKSGESFKYYHEGIWKTGYYDSASKIFVGVSDKITTVIDDVNLNYINNLKNAKP